MPTWQKLLVACCLALAAPAIAHAPVQAADRAPLCAACGQTIGPGRYVQDEWKANYHVEHAKLTRCFYCARGISTYTTRGGVRYPDGRDVCGLCQATAVTDVGTATQVAQSIRERMAGWGLGIDYGPIPVQLVDQRTLDSLFGRGGGMHDGRINGLTTKRWTKDRNGAVRSREVSIAMLYGLPLEIYEQTIAHELMHAWMFVDRHPDHSPALEEGVCNLASYYILQESSTPLSGFLKEAMYRSPNPTYGAGLRRAIRYVQANEFTGLVKMLRQNKDFPRGY